MSEYAVSEYAPTTDCRPDLGRVDTATPHALTERRRGLHAASPLDAARRRSKGVRPKRAQPRRAHLHRRAPLSLALGERHAPAPPPALPTRPARRPKHPAPPHPSVPTALPADALDEALRAWLDEEVGTLTRLAHTLRLKGDFVAAQLMEREVRYLTQQVVSACARVGK